MKNINLLSICMIGVIITSCSVNFYPDKLLQKWEPNPKALSNASEKELDKSFVFNGVNYALPLIANVKFSNDEEEEIKIVNYRRNTIRYHLVHSRFIQHINIDDIVDIVEIAPQDIKKIEVYFNPNFIERPFEIISIYHYRFFSFITPNPQLRVSIKHHVANCRKMGGDAVIVEPNLVNSTVIKFLDL